MLEEIKSLPPLPNSVIKIQEICMSSDADIEELSRVIESDPMLSANILKSVNSPLYGMSKEISSIPQAIMLFGISMIRGFAAASAIKKAVKVDLTPYNLTLDELTKISSLQMAFVKEWYRNIDKSMLPLLQSCAFMMELGKIVVSLKLVTSGNAPLFLQEASAVQSDEEAEKRFFGISSYEIAAQMFEHWNFEPALIDALRGISDPSTQNIYAKVLSVVAQAVNRNGAFTDEGIRSALELVERFGLNKEGFEEAVIGLKTVNKV
jgi:HD-like signal output (HDOD) protein